jgi:hypothetical protein
VRAKAARASSSVFLRLRSFLLFFVELELKLQGSGSVLEREFECPRGAISRPLDKIRDLRARAPLHARRLRFANGSRFAERFTNAFGFVAPNDAHRARCLVVYAKFPSTFARTVHRASREPF